MRTFLFFIRKSPDEWTDRRIIFEIFDIENDSDRVSFTVDTNEFDSLDSVQPFDKLVLDKLYAIQFEAEETTREYFHLKAFEINGNSVILYKSLESSI